MSYNKRCHWGGVNALRCVCVCYVYTREYIHNIHLEDSNAFACVYEEETDTCHMRRRITYILRTETESMRLHVT